MSLPFHFTKFKFVRGGQLISIEVILSILYKTSLGKFYIGNSDKLLSKKLHKSLKGKVQLIFTSPPFPLNQKKKYGNLKGEKYKEWFVSLASIYSELLTEDGSIVIELGNAWEPEKPVQSLLPLESLLGFVNNKEANLRLRGEKLRCCCK